MKQEKAWAANDGGWPEDWVNDWGDLLDRLMEEREIEKGTRPDRGRILRG
jgi:hypothetical protein